MASSPSPTATPRARSSSPASAPAIEAGAELAKSLGAKRAIVLPVSVAAHSPLMAEAADGMREALTGHRRSATRDAPLLANADARPIETAEACRAELVEHLTAGVDWIRVVERMAAAGVTTFVEVGPGRVLTGLIKRIAPDAEVIAGRRSGLARPAPRTRQRARLTVTVEDKENTPCASPTTTAASSSPASASSAPSATTSRPPGPASSMASPGLGPITRFDTTPYEAKLGGEVQDFDPAADWMDAKAARRSESSMHFGVAAAKQALADSGFEITDENRTEVGVVFGSGAGGQTLMIDNYALDQGARAAHRGTDLHRQRADRRCSGMIAIETGAIGHNICVVSACATGTHNVGEAAEAIRRGDCIAIISGSTEAPLLEVGHAGFSNMRGMGMPRPGEAPETVSRPFDLTRDGFVLGEGAGSLFLEDLELAKARGAQDLRRGRRLRLRGRRLGHDPADRGGHRLGAGDEDGPRAARRAGRRGRPDQPARHVDAARATSARPRRSGPSSGRARARRRGRSRSARTKSMTGHMMGAAGAFEAFATVMSVAEQLRPGHDQLPRLRTRTATCGSSRRRRPMPIRYALSNNIGLGGHNGAVIFKRYDGD